MFSLLRQGFDSAKAALTGQTTLTEANIDSAVRAVRRALLEADVHIEVVQRFVGEVKARALGEVVTLSAGGKSVRPADHFTRICYERLVALMGPSPKAPLTFRAPPTVIMLLGLQGVGKTTTCGKLAKYLQSQRRRPLLVGADLQRPAAQAQLMKLGERLGVPVYAPTMKSPQALVEGARAAAKAQKCDVIVLDTAGRLSIDTTLMDELVAIKRIGRPDETLLVVDAMAGQDSLTTAKGFADRLELSGFVMTKLDGDARGGAALSIKHLLKAPIKFLGTGEDLAKLEPFRAEGLASRILGMGDVVGLMHDFAAVVDEKKAEADAKKMLRGRFTLDDFLSQLRTLEKMGSVRDLVAKMPMMGGLKQADAANIDDKTFVVMRSMIQSMTKAERQDPKLISGRRLGRIARGSGRKQSEVEGLLQRFSAMQAMMAKLGRGGGLGALGKLAQGMPRGRPQLGGQAMPSFGGGGRMGGMQLPGLDFGQLQPRSQAGSNRFGGASQKSAEKKKAERKAEKKARKKGRR